MSALLKSAGNIDSRWSSLLCRYYPLHNQELAESALIVLAYIVNKAPEIWSRKETKGTKGFKSSHLHLKSLETVQKSFNDHLGVLASIVSVYNSWIKIPKRERPRWSKCNHVDHSAIAKIEDIVIKLQSDVDKIGRRRSLRSAAAPHKESRNEPLFDSLSRLLLSVFPDCLYKRISRSGVYINMVTATTMCLLEANDPNYILYLPNMRVQHPFYTIEDQLSISLVVNDFVANEALVTNKQLLKVANRMEQTSPVMVPLPEIGDAICLKLAGNFMAKSDLLEEICSKCSTPEHLTFVRLIDADAVTNGYKLEVICPRMYQEKVAAHMSKTVKTAMEELESSCDLIPLPNTNDDMKILLGSGGQILEIESNRHVVVLYLSTQNENPSVSNDVDEDDVKEFFKQFGPLETVKKSRYFPRSTFWGFVVFQHISPSRKAAQLSKGDNIKGFPILNAIYMKGDSPLLDVTFRWRKPVIVRNRYLMHFTSEEDLKKMKNHRWPDGVKAEVDEDEMKIVLTSEDSSRNLIDLEPSLMYATPVYPKFTTYYHHVIYEGNPGDLKKLESEVMNRIQEYLPDGDLVEMSAEKPKDGAPVLTGKFSSYSFHTLERLEDVLGFYNYNRLCGGEIHLERGVNMCFMIPEEAYKYLEPGLKKIQSDSVRLDTDNPDDDEQHEERTLEEARRVTRIETKNVWHTGFSVRVYREFYTGQDEKDVRALAKIMAPHNIKITGEMLARLQMKPHSYIIDLMKQTNTYICVMRKDCFLRIYGLEPNVFKVRNRIYDDLSNKEPQKKHRSCKKSPKVDPKPSCSTIQSKECTICFCPTSGKFYRLALCGHIYCSECFKHQIDFAISSREFPLRCGSSECNHTILHQDVMQICRDHDIQEIDLLQSSLQSFLRDNLPNVHSCITPDCTMVYHTTTSQNEGKNTAFKCPLCTVTMCTSCHTIFHEGLSCSVYKALNNVESRVRKWMFEDQETRKLCPNCLTGIEKDGGCDHVTCTACKAEICWLCLQFFFDSQKISYHNCVDRDNTGW